MSTAYFRSGTAIEPRPNNIITYSPMLGWLGSFTGKDLSHVPGTSNTTTNFPFTVVTAAGLSYYSKGVCFIDKVHHHGIIPAGSTFTIDVYSNCSSDQAVLDERLEGGIFIWRGALDQGAGDGPTSPAYTQLIGTFGIGVTSAITKYTFTETNTEDIVLYPGDCICVEFYGRIDATGVVAINKWNISIYYNSATYPSLVDYSSLEIQQFSKGRWFPL